MTNNMKALKKIIDSRIHPEICEAIVNSVNGMTAKITPIGQSGNQDANVSQGIPIAPENRCIAVRPTTSQLWTILATFGTRKTGYVKNVATDESSELFIPQNFGVITTLPGFLIYHWDVPPQKAVTIQVQTSHDGIDDHALTTLYTRGGYYIVSSTVNLYARIRSVDFSFKASTWTDWLQGTPETAIYNVIENNGEPVTPRKIINLIAGDHITVSVDDNEDNDSTDVTITGESGGGGTLPIYASAFQNESTPLAPGSTNWTYLYSSVTPHGFYVYQGTHANSDQFRTVPFLIAAGTYTLHLLGNANPANGILDLYLDSDGSPFEAGIDWYNVSNLDAVEKTVSITIPTDGNHTIKGVVNGQSGSDFYILLTNWWID